MDDSDGVESLYSDVCDDYSIEFDEAETFASTSAKPSSNSCRVCLSSCNDQSRNMEDFADLYATCTGFIIEKKNIPKKLCNSCFDQLQMVKRFMEKCSHTEEVLNDAGHDMDAESSSSLSDAKGDDVNGFESSKKTGRPKIVQPAHRVTYRPPPRQQIVHVNANGEIIKSKKGRPPKDLSKKRIKNISSDRPRGRPRLDPELKKRRKPPAMRGRGRPKGTTIDILSEKIKIKPEPKCERQIISGMNEKGEYEIRREDGTIEIRTEKQICYMCGKMVRLKHLPYHLWKHRKDKESETKSIEGNHIKCNFCHTIYKSETQRQAHMKRAHPAASISVVYDESIQPNDTNSEEVDNFEKECGAPSQEQYQIQTSYSHTQTLQYLQQYMNK